MSMKDKRSGTGISEGKIHTILKTHCALKRFSLCRYPFADSREKTNAKNMLRNLQQSLFLLVSR